MKEIKKAGLYVLDGKVVELAAGQVCAYPDSLVLEEFQNLNKLKAKYPKLHEEHTKDPMDRRFEEREAHRAALGSSLGG